LDPNTLETVAVSLTGGWDHLWK